MQAIGKGNMVLSLRSTDIDVGIGNRSYGKIPSPHGWLDLSDKNDRIKIANNGFDWLQRNIFSDAGKFTSFFGENSILKEFRNPGNLAPAPVQIKNPWSYGLGPI